jgi:hypothetical protein
MVGNVARYLWRTFAPALARGPSIAAWAQQVIAIVVATVAAIGWTVPIDLPCGGNRCECRPSRALRDFGLHGLSRSQPAVPADYRLLNRRAADAANGLLRKRAQAPFHAVSYRPGQTASNWHEHCDCGKQAEVHRNSRNGSFQLCNPEVTGSIPIRSITFAGPSSAGSSLNEHDARF